MELAPKCKNCGFWQHGDLGSSQQVEFLGFFFEIITQHVPKEFLKAQ